MHWIATLARTLAPLLLLCIGLGGVHAAPQADAEAAPAPPATALIMRVDGPIDAGHQALFRRAVVLAKSSGAPLIIAFDTPGGELARMRQFAGAIDSAVKDGVRVIGWVDDQALSAGTWLAIACESLYVRQRSSIGAAQAVQLTPTGMAPAGEKIASAYRAWVRGWAKTHGKNELLAEAMIDPGTEVRRVKIDGIEQDISGIRWDDLVAKGETPELIRTVVPEGTLLALTGAEAIEFGFADAMAESTETLLSKEGLAGLQLEPLDKTRSEDLLASLHGMRLLLLFLGLFFGYVELKIPGFGIPGGLSILCFIGLFVGQYLIGLADIPHVVLAAVGVVLVGTEIFVVPGMIWPGLVGATCLVVGLLMSQVGPDLSMGDAWDRQLLFDATYQLVATAAAGVFAIWTLSRFLPQTPVLGRMVLAGAGGAADAMPEARDES
ncbi:MAG: NfeD family protein, partial [Planctomycetota bacterium]